MSALKEYLEENDIADAAKSILCRLKKHSVKKIFFFSCWQQETRLEKGIIVNTELERSRMRRKQGFFQSSFRGGDITREQIH